jgi:hypothetical protein
LAACLGFGQIVSTYSDLHDFGGTVTNANGVSGPDGSNPSAGVTFDSAGNMYGTAQNGGPHGENGGMVWEITMSGTYLDLHDFGGNAVNANGVNGRDGIVPGEGVTFDSAGNMYGTAVYGGPNAGRYGDGAGMVWEITTAGTYRDLHDFGGTVVNAGGTSGPDGTYPDAGVAFDSAGNMYGTTGSGGPNVGFGNGAGMLWEITNAGTYRDLHDFGASVVRPGQASGVEAAYPGGVTFDGVGNLYGTTSRGGTKDNGVDSGGVLWEITKSGIYQHLHDFGAPDGSGPGGVTVDSSGNLFGIASDGGANSGGTVWEITKSGYYNVLHNFGGTLVNADGKKVSDGKLPSGVTVDSEGNLYGTAWMGGPNNSALQGDGMVWEITNTGFYRDLHDFGATSPVKDGIYPNPGVTFDRAGNLVGTTAVGGPNGTVQGNGILWKLAIATVRLQSFTLTPNAVIGGASSTGRIVLSNPVPVGGLLVTLSSNSSSATPPVTVMVPEGSGSTSFTMTTSAVATAVSATITATLGTSSLTASLAVHPAYPASVSVSPASVVGGASSTGTVTLNGPAPAGGWGVRLSSSSPSVSIPTYVVVAAGAKSATFPISTSPVASDVAVTITATLNSFSKSAQLTVTP